jgi:hypothetical protein
LLVQVVHPPAGRIAAVDLVGGAVRVAGDGDLDAVVRGQVRRDAVLEAPERPGRRVGVASDALIGGERSKRRLAQRLDLALGGPDAGCPCRA